VKNNREKIRALFVSDLHLGCKHCKASEFLEFIRNIDAEYLYLVGDIVDGWKMKKGIYWDDTYSFIVRRIIGMIKDGTKVVYLAGNHDEFLRKFLPHSFGHFSLKDNEIHTCLDGRKLLVIHGDIFDHFTMKFPWLYRLGDKAYSVAMWMNDVLNYLRRKIGLKYWSLSLLLKQNVKQAVNFVNNFEHFIVKHANLFHCQGVVCGHIHSAAIKKFDEITYYNCGDWVESCTALIEHLDGTFELRDVNEHP